MKSSALVVLSGGQDSTTCAAIAARDYDEWHAFTVDYGQRHSREIVAARKVAEMLGAASHEVLEIGPVLKGASFLTDKTREVQTFDSFEAMTHFNAFKENKLDSSFVPMRNVLFLTLAANRAAVMGCNTIITGVTAADFAEYGGFSWEWLGGFVDAEGTFSRPNDTGWRLEVSQKDPELLHRLQRWLESECGGSFTSSIHIDKRDCATLYIGLRSAAPLMSRLSPHLHSLHRRNQAEARGAVLSPEAELTDAYVTGFWEGDGACYGWMSLTKSAKRKGTGETTAAFKFDFFQKDAGVLEKIQTYLGRGYVYLRDTQGQNPIWVLTVSDGPVSAKLLQRLRPHLNILGSFEKITKWRHRIDLTAGGFNPPYPDCTPDFIRNMQKGIDEALRTPFSEPPKIETPLMFLTKAQSVRLAKKLPRCWDALAHSHTSYSGEYPPVTQDHASVLRAQGFVEAGEPDPLIVRAWAEGLCKLPKTPNYAAIRASRGCGEEEEAEKSTSYSGA